MKLVENCTTLDSVDMFLPKIFARPDDEPPVQRGALEPSNEKTTDNATRITAQANDDASSIEVQDGVLKMEAVSQVWSRNHIIIAYVL